MAMSQHSRSGSHKRSLILLQDGPLLQVYPIKNTSLPIKMEEDMCPGRHRNEAGLEIDIFLGNQ